MTTRSFLVVLGAGVWLALACGERESAPPGPAPAPAPAPASAPAAAPAAAPSGAAVAEAKQIFESRCVACHGPAGGGDGPGSAALSPKPRNFQDPVWQDSVSDEHIEQIVMYGGAAVGKSPSMPSNPDLTSKPEVVRALAQYVRGLVRR